MNALSETEFEALLDSARQIGVVVTAANEQREPLLLRQAMHLLELASGRDYELEALTREDLAAIRDLFEEITRRRLEAAPALEAQH